MQNPLKDYSSQLCSLCKKCKSTSTSAINKDDYTTQQMKDKEIIWTSQWMQKKVLDKSNISSWCKVNKLNIAGIYFNIMKRAYSEQQLTG